MTTRKAKKVKAPKPVKAWGLKRNGKLLPLTGRSKSWMKINYEGYAEIVPVEIRIIPRKKK